MELNKTPSLPTEYCKAIIFQFKINKWNKNRTPSLFYRSLHRRCHLLRVKPVPSICKELEIRRKKCLRYFKWWWLQRRCLLTMWTGKLKELFVTWEKNDEVRSGGRRWEERERFLGRYCAACPGSHSVPEAIILFLPLGSMTSACVLTVTLYFCLNWLH